MDDFYSRNLMRDLVGDPRKDDMPEPEDKDHTQAMARLRDLEEEMNEICDRCGVHICTDHAKIAEEIEQIKSFYNIE